jgi:Spy/CpxP family protein refolding chaperone
MRKNYLSLCLLTAVIIFFLSVFACSQDQPVQNTEQPKMIYEFNKELNLTSDQINKLKAVSTEYQQNALVYQRNSMYLSKEFNELIQQNAGIDALKYKLQQIADFKVEIDINEIILSRRINSILTKEQLDKWKNIQKDFSDRSNLKSK